jgi:hypothetical protein
MFVFAPLILGPLIALAFARRKGPLRSLQALGASMIGAFLGYGALWLLLESIVRYGVPHLPFDFAVGIVRTFPTPSQALTALAALTVLGALVAGIFLFFQWLIGRLNRG